MRSRSPSESALAFSAAMGHLSDGVAEHDVPLQGPDLRARDLGDRRARDRHRRPARLAGTSPHSRGREASRAIRGRARSSSRASAAIVVIPRVRGHQGRIHLDGLRDLRRRAEPDLPLPDPLRRDGARLRTRGRPRLGDRRGGGLHGLRRQRDAARPHQYPYYEAPGLSIARLREPRARLGAKAQSRTRSSSVSASSRSWSSSR